MNQIASPVATADIATEIVYPVRDGKPMAETGVHVVLMVTLIAALRHYFRARSDVYVIGNIFLYYEEGHPEARCSPDIMVIKEVEPGGERPSFKIWEEKAVPCVIIELTSRETAEEDVGPKHELYEKLGVREYFLFDPLHHFLERPLIGYRLIGGKYESLPPADDGGLLSAELGMRLVPEDTQLALYSFRTDERILAPQEAYQLLEETQQQKSQAEQRASQAEQRTSQIEEAFKQERRRAEELAAELARLRALLPPERSGENPAQQ
jgi:Uma2 family endonuclease